MAHALNDCKFHKQQFVSFFSASRSGGKS